MTYDLTDSQWARLEPLLPPPPSSKRGGRPRYRSRRELIDGMRWRFRTGKRWDHLPARYGPHQTTYALFQAWRKDGTWERLALELGAGSEARTIIPWVQQLSLDGSRPVHLVTLTAERPSAKPAGTAFNDALPFRPVRTGRSSPDSAIRGARTSHRG